MLDLKSLNLSIFHAINGFCGWNPLLDRFVAIMDYSELKGLVLVGTFGVLWFQPGKEQGRARSSLVVMLFAVALAILVARTLAFVLPFEVRPMYALDIGYREPLFSKRDYTFEAWSAFPSDTAAMMFALATGFWFASWLAGALVGILVLLLFLLASILAFIFQATCLLGH